MTSEHSVKVTSIIKAPPEVVFDAWLDPNAIAQWMFDPSYKQQQVIDISLDPTIGGAFRFSVIRQGKRITYEGEFLEIKRPHFLSLSWRVVGVGRDTRVKVTVEPRKDGSLLTLVHSLGPVPDKIAKEVHQDWSADFASLSKLLM